jgi:hydroxypyruvate isomerase
MRLDREITHSVTRRSLLQGAAATAAAIALPSAAHAARRRRRSDAASGRVVTKGRINQSVCAWCFDPMPLETLAGHAAAIGLKSVELVDPKNWPVLKEHGLVCAIASSHGFVDGMNRKENHAMCIDKIKAAVDACAEAGFPSVITFSGFSKGMPPDVGLDNTVEGLKKVIGYAEKKGVNLCLEVLNSRVDVEMKGHPDYMADNVEWVAEACKRVGSPRMKILFDIYHVQIMQGDVITRIRQYKDYIGHYHTAGVPGRNEIDETQELNYPAIMNVIAETGYTGYVGQEFIPTHDPISSLREAVRLCDV